MRLKLDEHWVSFQEKHTGVPQRGLLVPNPEGFPLYLPDYNFSAKMPLVAPHCLWNTVITSGIKAARLLKLLDPNKNSTLPKTKLDTIPLSFRHGSSLPLLSPSCALMPACLCSHGALCWECPPSYPSPGRKLLLLPQGIQFNYFHAHLHPMQPLCPAVHLDSDSTMFSPML